ALARPALGRGRAGSGAAPGIRGWRAARRRGRPARGQDHADRGDHPGRAGRHHGGVRRRAADRRRTVLRGLDPKDGHMKPGIHPDYHPVVFQDASTGRTFLTRSTATSNRTIEWEDGNSYPLLVVDITADS